MTRLVRRARPFIGILALALVAGTVGCMETGSLGMTAGSIRCAVLLGVAAWGCWGG